MQTATVVTQNDCQTVQLPIGVHLEGDEVLVKQIGQSVILVPKDANHWQPLIDSLDQFSDDFMAERSQPAEQIRATVFE